MVGAFLESSVGRLAAWTAARSDDTFSAFVGRTGSSAVVQTDAGSTTSGFTNPAAAKIRIVAGKPVCLALGAPAPTVATVVVWLPLESVPSSAGCERGEHRQEGERGQLGRLSGKHGGSLPEGGCHLHRGRSLNAWRINLSRSVTNELETPTPLRLVELVPAPTARDDARYLVRVRDLAIELGPDFDDETLVRLVRALRSC